MNKYNMQEVVPRKKDDISLSPPLPPCAYYSKLTLFMIYLASTHTYVYSSLLIYTYLLYMGGGGPKTTSSSKIN